VYVTLTTNIDVSVTLYSQNDKQLFLFIVLALLGLIIFCLTTLTQDIDPSMVIAVYHTQQSIFRTYSSYAIRQQ